MPAPAVVAVRDLICAILRDHPIVLDSEQVADLVHRNGGPVLTAPEAWNHCQALHVAGYLQKWAADGVEHATRWCWIEPAVAASPHRRVDVITEREFAALAQLATDPGPTR